MIVSLTKKKMERQVLMNYVLRNTLCLSFDSCERRASPPAPPSCRQSTPPEGGSVISWVRAYFFPLRMRPWVACDSPRKTKLHPTCGGSRDFWWYALALRVGATGLQVNRTSVLQFGSGVKSANLKVVRHLSATAGPPTAPLCYLVLLRTKSTVTTGQDSTTSPNRKCLARTVNRIITSSGDRSEHAH